MNTATETRARRPVIDRQRLIEITAAAAPDITDEQAEVLRRCLPPIQRSQA